MLLYWLCLVVIFHLLTPFSQATPVTCPCQNKSWCQTITNEPQREVFIFSVTNKNWQLYDWSKVTTVVQAGYVDSALMCFAHSKGVRVVSLVNYPVGELTNSSAREMWLAKQVTMVTNNFLDGINIDFESPLSKANESARAGLTALVQGAVEGIKKYVKGAQVTFDVAWSPDCIDERCYNYTEIARATDFIFVMAYDERSQIQGDCIAWANSALNTTAYGVNRFLSMGIPANKIVLGVPWYGYDYPCVNLSKTNVCEIKKVPFRGVNCSDAAGTQFNYADIKGSLVKNATTHPMWDKVAESPYFNYKDQTGQMHQVWYDNSTSLQIKYEFAKKQNLRGVGMWHADALNYTNTEEGRTERKQMWGALPPH